MFKEVKYALKKKEVFMTHYMKLNSQPYALIKNRVKTIELRLYDEKRKRIEIGDSIVFSHAKNPQDYLTAEVIALYVFKDFSELYQKLPLEKCGYSTDELCSASPEDMVKYYSIEEQRKHGVVGIEIKLNS